MKFPLIFYGIFLMYIAYVVCFFMLLIVSLFYVLHLQLSLLFLWYAHKNRWGNLSMVLDLVSKFDCSLRSDNKPRFPPTMERGGFLLFSKPSSNSMLSLTAPFGVTTSLVFPLVWNGEDSSSFQSPHQTRCYV